MIKPAFAAAVAFATLGHLNAAPLCAASVEIEAEGPVIELSIYEEVEAEPDLVTIGAGVATDALTAVEALRLNSVEMRRVIERVKALGIDEKDIQTSGISLNADYSYNDQTRQSEFKGYSASNRVSIKLRDIDTTGQALDALVVAGATDLSGPSFMLSDDTAAKTQARTRAMARGEELALEYAAKLGMDGAKVLMVEEGTAGRSISRGNVLGAFAAKTSVETMAPVQPGMVSTGVLLTITYELTGGEAASTTGE